MAAELLARLTTIDEGARADLIVDSFDARAWTVSIHPIGQKNGVTIGMGNTRRAALYDAIECLQASLDSIHVAILKG